MRVGHDLEDCFAIFEQDVAGFVVEADDGFGNSTGDIG